MSDKANQLTQTSRLAAAAIAAIAIAGCGGNAASPPGAVTVVPPASSTLQLAVGTANLAGTSGLNVVTTLRTPQGKSVLVSTPTLTGPFALPATAGTPNGSGATITTGPSAAEIAAGGTISGTPQVSPGTQNIASSTFGVAGGVFAGGFQPSNADNLGTAQLAPYAQPNYNSCAAINPDCNGGVDTGDPVNANAFLPIGGPPAFDPNGNGEGTRDGTFATGVNGVNQGINIFSGVTTKVGTYSEAALIPTTGKSTTLTTTFTLSALHTLGTVTAPAFAPDGAGGGTFNVTLPAGVTDAIVNIEDLGPASGAINCYTNGSYPAYFSLHVTASGVATLPDTDGVGSPTVHNPTICTAAQNTAANGAATAGDSYTVQLIGADYPLYASNVLFTLSTPNPAIVGSAGSDDITVSTVASGTST